MQNIITGLPLGSTGTPRLQAAGQAAPCLAVSAAGSWVTESSPVGAWTQGEASLPSERNSGGAPLAGPEWIIQPGEPVLFEQMPIRTTPVRPTRW